MNTKLIISHWCQFRNAVFSVNGEVRLRLDESSDIQDALREVYKALDLKYPKFYKMDNLSKLGFLTAEVLIQGIVDFENYNKEKVGVFITNQYSCLDTDERYFRTVTDVEALPSPSLFVYTLPNILIGELCIRHKLTGEHGFFLGKELDSTLCAYIQHLFEEKIIEAALVGAVEYYNDQHETLLLWVIPANEDSEKPVFDKETVLNILYK